MLFVSLSAFGLLGFIASVIVHIYGLLEHTSPLGNWAWALHIGIFPLFFPLVYYANKTKPENAGRDNITHLMRELPPPVYIASKAIFGYTILNFVVFIYVSSKYPKKEVPEWLTQRGFSGHWMMFYSAICLGFWGLHLLEKKKENQAAPFGRRVS